MKTMIAGDSPRARTVIAGCAAGAIALLVLGCGGGSTSSSATPPAKPAPLSITALVAKVKTGIVKIETSTCDGQFVGTGFLLGPRLVATVEHVIDGAQTITLTQNGKVVGEGTVIGSDVARDIALVSSSRPIPGYRFHFAARSPALSEDVHALGFPLDLPLTVTHGSVSGLDRTIPINGIDRRDLVQTDAAVNPGNSGGPLVSDTGTVVGLVDLGTDQANGLAFAVSARVAAPLLAGWAAAPQPIAATACSPSSSPQATPPAASSTIGSTGTLTYTGAAFSIEYPATFVVTAAEVTQGRTVDTTITGPTGSDFLIRVDENPAGHTGSLDAGAAPVVKTLRGEPGYRQIAYYHTTFEGYAALWWEFEVPEASVLLHKVDLFFTDSSGADWGILTQAPASEYANASAAFDALRQSFTEP